MRGTDPKTFFSEEEQTQITQTIQQVEQETSGEICVRIERECKKDVLMHCSELLDTLGITATAGRTGILIYISLQDKKAGVYGDEAIHQKIGNDGWTNICTQMISNFQQERFCEGVCEAIREVGSVLSQHFPATAQNPDELPDKPSLE